MSVNDELIELKKKEGEKTKAITPRKTLPVINVQEVCVDEQAIVTCCTRLSQARSGLGFIKNKGWELCLRVAQGQTLKQICALKHMPDINTVLGWIHPDPELVTDAVTKFQQDYKRAVNQQNELLMDELVILARSARDKDTAQCAKVVLDAMKFRLERTQADKFGPTSRVVREDKVGILGGDAEAAASTLDAALTLVAERRRLRGVIDVEAAKPASLSQ